MPINGWHLTPMHIEGKLEESRKMRERTRERLRSTHTSAKTVFPIVLAAFDRENVLFAALALHSPSLSERLCRVRLARIVQFLDKSFFFFSYCK